MRVNAFFILLILPALLFAQAYEQNEDAQFSYGSMEVQRSLQVAPIGQVSSATGAAVPTYESTITIAIKNTANEAKRNVALSEDLSYLPANAKITYSVAPDEQKDQKAVWNIGTLQPQEQFVVKISAPATVSPSAIKALDAPQIEYTKPNAVLKAPISAGKGDGISLSLQDSKGRGISDAYIRITYPDGQAKLVATNSKGEVGIIAQNEGFYVFEVVDYNVGSCHKTEVVAQSAQKVQAANGLAQENGQQKQPAQGNKQDAAGLDPIMSFLPIAIGILIVLLIAYMLYKYFTSPVEEDDTPIPPAPATRPSISNEDSGLAGMQNQETQKSPIAYGTEGDTVYPPQASAQEQSDEEIDMLSQSLISKRREKMQENKKEEETPKEDAQIEQIEYEKKSEAAFTEPKEEELDEEIDEEAIKKTIAELEQLRRQLKEGSMDDDEGPKSEEETEDAPAQSDDEYAFAGQEDEPKKHSIDNINQKIREEKKSELIDDDIEQLIGESEKVAPSQKKKTLLRAKPKMLKMPKPKQLAKAGAKKAKRGRPPKKKR